MLHHVTSIKENAKTGDISNIIRHSICSISNAESLGKCKWNKQTWSLTLEVCMRLFSYKIVYSKLTFVYKSFVCAQELTDFVRDCML